VSAATARRRRPGSCARRTVPAGWRP
jgi:hypothetical protein